ncbi:MAG: hypothetical protein ABI137_11445 [Antricoccus sp.]
MNKPSDSESADLTPVDPTPVAPVFADPPASTRVPIDPASSDSDFDLPRSPLADTYYNAHGVPTFDAVRERIEQRTALADGNEVLDDESEKGVDFAKEREKLDQAGKDRLAQIRKSMGL